MRPASERKVHVVKMGGAEGVGLEALCDDLAVLWKDGARWVCCHGGSDATNRLAKSLGHPPEFVTSVSGHVSRRTDRRTLEIFTMATAGINRRLVELLQARGVNALGLSGLDGALLRAQRKAAIRVLENGRQRILRDDWTGTPTEVNGALLEMLLDAGYLPVMAPLGLSPEGESLNIDGDRGAALVAATLGAASLIVLTNVPGLLERFPDPKSLISHVPTAGLERAKNLAEGRMRKKILGAEEALAGGVSRVILADGRRSAPLSAALSGEGTVLGAPLESGSHPTTSCDGAQAHER